jgi:hypothetical protein
VLLAALTHAVLRLHVGRLWVVAEIGGILRPRLGAALGLILARCLLNWLPLLLLTLLLWIVRLIRHDSPFHAAS